MHSNVTTHLLSQTAYWRLSKTFVENLGLHKAFILTTLIDKSEYFISINQAQDGWFYYRQQDMIQHCPIAEKTLRDIVQEFCDKGFIQKELRQEGQDRRNYFKINAHQISEFITNCLIEKSKNQNATL